MLKAFLKQMLQARGIEAQHIQPAGTAPRPIGRTFNILEDVRARGFMPQLVFDLGANNGGWTKIAAQILQGARFVLVEPLPRMQPALTAMAQSNPRYSVVAAAVGGAPGSAMLTDWDTGSTILPVDAAGASQTTVAVTTLDALAGQWGVPDFVKVDVEGLELEALQGAGSILGKTELFVIEVALFRFVNRPVLHDVVAFMAEHGYWVYDVGDPIRRPFDGALGLLDLFFSRRDGELHRWEQAWYSESSK